MRQIILIVAAAALVAAGGAYAAAQLRTIRLRPGRCATVNHVRVCAREAPTVTRTITRTVAVTPASCRLAMQDIAGLVDLYRQRAGEADAIVQQAQAVIAGRPSDATAVNAAAAAVANLNTQIANATAGYDTAATECGAAA